MSEQGEKPEVLPGDLITRPGLYESRGGTIVPITGWDNGWWTSEWDGALDWYGSDGRRRFYEAAGADEWQLLHWVAPLLENMPERVTTTEQLAEIEGQQEPIQVREGRWRTRAGEIRNVTPTPEGDGRKKRYPWWDAQWHGSWTADGRYHFGAEGPLDLVEYLGPIEPQPEQKPQAETEAQPETQPQPIQVREGRWKTRAGEIVSVSAMPTDDDNFSPAYPWWDGDVATWADDGVFFSGYTADKDLVEYLGPIEPQPQPEPQAEPEPIQVREGRWKTRGGDIRNVTPTPEGDGREERFPWWDAAYRQTWTSDGRYHFGEASPGDLIEYLGPIQPEPEPQPQPEPPMLQDADDRIRLLKQANDAQAETIGRLKTEARYLNMEIGGLERQLLQRDARIRDLETLHAAATQAVVDAGKQNDALRLQVQNRQQEHERQKGRIEFLETLDAGNAVAICDYRTQVNKLQGLVDFARKQLEDAANEISQQRSHLDAAEKQLDQKDAQIRNLRIELDAAQQVPQPVSDEERERIWNEATEAAGRQVVRWLRPLTLALHRQPDERFSRFMALTLSVLPDVLPELLGYAVEDETDGDCEE